MQQKEISQQKEILQQKDIMVESGFVMRQEKSKSVSPSSRTPNPDYAVKFNEEALKQQQQQEQQRRIHHRGHVSSNEGESSPSNSMFQSRSVTCAGSVSFRCMSAKQCIFQS
jgi:hypothetical protein